MVVNAERFPQGGGDAQQALRREPMLPALTPTPDDNGMHVSPGSSGNAELLERLTEVIDPVAFAPGRADTQSRRYDQQEARRAVLDVLRTLRDHGPTEEMVRRTLLDADNFDLLEDFGASVIEGMPPLAPALQSDGIRAAAEVQRDFVLLLSNLIEASEK